MELLRRIAAYIRTMYGNMNGPQKAAVAALAVLVLAVIVWGATSLTADGWTKIVGTEATREERSEVTKKLTEKNIRYEVRNEEIYVRKDQADQAVIDLHGEGVLSDATLWKFLDEANITASKWQQEKRYQVAVQRKLERMISSMQPVKRASVLLAPGDVRDTFGAQGSSPSATVTVQLHPGKELTRANVSAIARLVANGTTGLKPHNVVIADTTGRAWRLPQSDTDWQMAENRLEMEKQYAEYFEGKIQRLFPGAMPAVFMELSSEAKKILEKEFGAPKAVEKESRAETEKGGTQGGFPGPKKGEGAEVPADLTSRTERDASENRQKFAIPERVIETMVREGLVKSKSVSVVLPIVVGATDRFEDLAAREQANVTAYQESIMNIVGLTDPARVKVTFAPVPKAAEIPAPTWKEKMGEILEKWGGTLVLFLLVLAALIIVYRLLKAALPRRMVEDLEALRRKLGEEAVVTTPPELALAEEEIGRMKLTIREMVAKNPRNVAGIMKRWMTGK